jgi:hypothetical protein
MDFAKAISKDKDLKDVKVRFMGLFDPVEGGVKGFSRDDTVPDIFTNKPNVFYAKNETRNSFATTVYPANKIDAEFYPGNHCDVGGYYKDRSLSDVTLANMIDRGISRGAPFDMAKIKNVINSHTHKKVPEEIYNPNGPGHLEPMTYGFGHSSRFRPPERNFMDDFFDRLENKLFPKTQSP